MQPGCLRVRQVSQGLYRKIIQPNYAVVLFALLLKFYQNILPICNRNSFHAKAFFSN
jgi:hypothetical protein